MRSWKPLRGDGMRMEEENLDSLVVLRGSGTWAKILPILRDSFQDLREALWLVLEQKRAISYHAWMGNENPE